MAIRLVVADNHPLILNGLENLFRKEGDFQVVARCNGAMETLEAVRRHRPDVLILPYSMPVKDGLEIARELMATGSPLHAEQMQEIQGLQIRKIPTFHHSILDLVRSRSVIPRQ